MENLLYTLWLHLLPGIGPYLIKNLLATFDNATAIYHATTELSAYLASQSISILSGMAKGTDSYAHTTAIKNNGYTVAVVGTGLDCCYPSEHLSLMKKIIETGAVISQFPPFTTVHKQNFIRRNELIAMLSDQVYVMQPLSTNKSIHFQAASMIS